MPQPGPSNPKPAKTKAEGIARGRMTRPAFGAHREFNRSEGTLFSFIVFLFAVPLILRDALSNENARLSHTIIPEHRFSGIANFETRKTHRREQEFAFPRPAAISGRCAASVRTASQRLEFGVVSMSMLSINTKTPFPHYAWAVTQ